MSSNNSLLTVSRNEVALSNGKDSEKVPISYENVPRTSRLLAPIILLTGQELTISKVKFSPDGRNLASSSYDRTINIWSIGIDCQNWCVLKNHKYAITDITWSRDSRLVYSCSADKSVRCYDVETATRTIKYRGHATFVTCIDRAREGPETIVTGSDDGLVKTWDQHSKRPCVQIRTHLPVIDLQFALSAQGLFTASVDNNVKFWDLRNTREPVYELEGHRDTICGLSLSPDGSQLLSNSFDDSLRIWNVKPFCPTADRCVALLVGAPHDFKRQFVRPCWSRRGKFVACGSADRSVVVWDSVTGKILYKLPGHEGSVLSVDWHPEEPIIASGGEDKKIYLGELNVFE